MGTHTKIEWADHTLNFWIGCTAVSPGCANCYAEKQDRQRKWTPEGWGRGKPRRRTSPATWGQLARWNNANLKAGTRARVFVNSLSDFFDDEVPPEWRNAARKEMLRNHTLDYLLVTKRLNEWCEDTCKWLHHRGVKFALLATVENQEWAEKRIPRLLEIPATWHGVSMEPLLGPVCLRQVWPTETDVVLDAMTGKYRGEDGGEGVWGFGPKLDWVIIGGESGDKRRPMELPWLENVARDCVAADVRVFVKQDVAFRSGEQGRIPPDVWRLKQFPEGMAVWNPPASRKVVHSA